jgi:hypothetical protein
MAKYLIVATWNGDDMEGNNHASIVDLVDDNAARQHIELMFKNDTRQVHNGVVINENQDVSLLEYECGFNEHASDENEDVYDDAGSYWFSELSEATPFAVAIQCNINQAVILETNLDYEDFKELHFDDNDEVEYLEVTDEYEFIDDGELVHKIIKL